MTKREIETVEHDMVTLRDYLDSQCRARHQAVDARFDSIDKATGTAYSAMNERLASMNEFRNALTDMSSKLLTRSEFEAVHRPLVEDIRQLRESRAELQGKASSNAVYIGYALAGIGLMIAVIALFK